MRERDPGEVIEALQSYGISTAQLEPVPSVALGILEVITTLESQITKLETERDAAAATERKRIVQEILEASIPLPIDLWQGSRKELLAAFARALAEHVRNQE